MTSEHRSWEGCASDYVMVLLMGKEYSAITAFGTPYRDEVKGIPNVFGIRCRDCSASNR